jgi:flavin-dependent dehydrogenase
MPEMRPLRPASSRYDVIVLGGGLAGLTLAIHLKSLRPETEVAVLEKREGPAPDAAFKVGESTVHSGAHYFATTVGMKEHLKNDQLPKCSLRFFMPADDNRDITRRVEFGPPTWPPDVHYQVDRGRFENALAGRALSAGVDLLQGCRVEDVEVGSGTHRVRFSQLGQPSEAEARWVVDAGGRASILKRKLGLAQDVGHRINSSWLRLGGGLDLEEWGAADQEWMGRMFEPGIRRFSTNHLIGEGYWVWLIPLVSGPISIGVCADPRFHPFEEINELDRLLEWFGRHEPQLAEALEPRLGDVQDFLRIEDFAFGCERLISPDGWSLVGEAGAFADPFYSPGSDIIAYGNTFTADLIVRSLSGEDVSERAEYFNDFLMRTFERTIVSYEDEYELFGNPLVMGAKLTWDAIVNHIFPTLLVIAQRLADLDLLRAVEPDIDRAYRLHERMQRLFRDWHQQERQPWEGEMVQVVAVKPFIQSTVDVAEEYDDESKIKTTFTRYADALEAFAIVIFARAARAVGRQIEPGQVVNPYAITLDPEAWDADGTLAEPGLTLAAAEELVGDASVLWPKP